MKQPVDVVYESGGTVVATCDRVLITYVPAEITLEFLIAASKAGRELSGKFPGGIGSYTLAPGPIPLPGDAVRAAARRNTIESNEWVKGAVTVIGGSGFWAAAARGMLTGMNFISAGGPPRKVFRRADEAIDWMETTIGFGPGTTATLKEWSAERLESAEEAF